MNNDSQIKIVSIPLPKKPPVNAQNIADLILERSDKLVASVDILLKPEEDLFFRSGWGEITNQAFVLAAIALKLDYPGSYGDAVNEFGKDAGNYLRNVVGHSILYCSPKTGFPTFDNPVPIVKVYSNSDYQWYLDNRSLFLK